MRAFMSKVLTGLVAAVLALVAQLAVAQEYPAREIRSICNFVAGSGADILVRYYSEKLSKLAGKPVIVENKVGAQGTIATDFVARSKPDGYTIMITPASATLAAAPHLFKQLPFDPVKDFTPVTTLASLPFVIAVDANKPIHSIAELIDHLKARPDNGFYATGPASGVVAGELFKQKTGLKTVFVPYKTVVNAFSDHLGGQTDFIVYDATWTAIQARAGKLRMLAVTSATRSAALPNVPTMAESGFSDYDITAWWGVVVPTATPKPIVERLTAWFNQISASEETRQFLQRVTTDAFPGTQQSMEALLKSDIEKWRRFVSLAKIEPQ